MIVGNKKNLFNILLLNPCWLACYISFFLFNFFMKYIKGDIYTISIALGFSCLGFLFSDLLINRIGVQFTFMICYLMTSVFLIAIYFINPETSPILLYAFLFFMMKSFVCASFATIYIVHVEIFEPRILSTTYGIAGTSSRISGLFIPSLAEVDNKTVPIVVILILNSVAFVLASLIQYIP